MADMGAAVGGDDYGNGDDDITWGRMILVGPRTPIGRLAK